MTRCLPPAHGAPRPSRPGPGRPPGSKNRRLATRHDVGRVLATGEDSAVPPTIKSAQNRVELAKRQAERDQIEWRIRGAIDRLLTGHFPPGGACDVKTLAREAGISRASLYPDLGPSQKRVRATPSRRLGRRTSARSPRGPDRTPAGHQPATHQQTRPQTHRVQPAQGASPAIAVRIGSQRRRAPAPPARAEYVPRSGSRAGGQHHGCHPPARALMSRRAQGRRPAEGPPGRRPA